MAKMASNVLYVVLHALAAMPLCQCGDKRAGLPQLADEVTEFTECNTTGTLPSWVDGVVLRQQCGALGSPYAPAGSHVEHMLDCVAMAAAYKVQRGKVQYAARFIDGRPRRILAENDMDMSLARVAWQTAFSGIDYEAFRVYESKFADAADMNANAMFWLTGDGADLLAVPPLGTDALKLDAGTLDSGNVYTFGGEWAKAFVAGTRFANNVAHGAVDKEGNIYSSVLALEPSKLAGEAGRVFAAKRVVYRVDYISGNRTTVAAFAASDRQIDLGLCDYQQAAGQWVYYDRFFKVGYVPCVSLTEHYIIVPSTSYFFNPCALLPQSYRGPATPAVKTWFAEDNSQQAPASVHILSKADGSVARSYNTESALFFLHAINAHEDTDGKKLVYYDVLAYTSGSKVLQKYMTVRFLVDLANSWPQEEKAMRFTLDIDTGLWTASALTPSEQVMSIEFPTINGNHLGRPYKYAYFVQQPYSDHSLVVKLDVDTKTTSTWTPPGHDIYVSQPVFVARTSSAEPDDEDDGVLLVPAFNSTSKLGVLYALDAATMKATGSAVAPAMSGYGLHSQYFDGRTLGIGNGSECRGRAAGIVLVGSLAAVFFVACVMRS